MKKCMQLVLILVVLTIASGCESSEDEGRETKNIENVEAVNVFQEDISSEVTEVGALTVNGDGTIYLTAPNLYKLIAFSSEGELVNTVGTQGQGPGEFEHDPRFVGHHSNELYVGEATRTRSVSVFDEDLSFLRRIDFSQNIGSLNFSFMNGQMIFPVMKMERDSQEGEMYASTTLRMLDEDTQEFTPFLELKDQKELGSLWRNIGVLRSHRDVAVFAYSFRNVIEVINTLSSSESHIIVELPIEEEPEFRTETLSTMSSEIPTSSVIGGLAVDNGHVFVKGGSVTDELMQTVFVLNPSGELVGTIDLGAPGSAFYVRDGYIYYVTEDAVLTKLRYDTKALDA
jgi:hypothetical protein